MDKLGCVRGTPYYEEYSAKYYYGIHSWLNSVARLTGYPRSKEIRVKTRADGTVEQVLVIAGTAAATEAFGQLNWLEDQ